MVNLAIIPWGWSRRGWDHYRVAQQVGSAQETVCKHRLRSVAERCITHRIGGGTECVDLLPVGREWDELLNSLSRLTALATIQHRDPEGLHETAEKIRDIAAGLAVMTAKD